MTTGVIDGVAYLFAATGPDLAIYEILADGDLSGAARITGAVAPHAGPSWLGKVVSVEGFEILITPPVTENGLSLRTANPIIIFGAGNDVGVGSAGNDYIHGGADSDSLYGEGGDDHLVGGDGADYLAGDTGDDLLEGGAGVDALDGYLGDDRLFGGDGADTLFGDAGADVLDGGAGSDHLIGWAGDDTYFTDDPDEITEYYDEGIDTVRTTATFVLPLNVENLVLLGVRTAIDGYGNGLNNVITGTGGANVLAGDSGDDTLNGGAGADVLFGDLGADALDGGAGDDTLYGGDGSDTLYGGLGADTLEDTVGTNVLYGGRGNDTYRVAHTDDTIHEDAAGGVDTVVLVAGWQHVLADNVENLTCLVATGAELAGNSLNNVIIGGAGDDYITGVGGNDTLQGGFGADQLRGGDGADSLLGGDGNDELRGDAGADKLTGGAGADRFWFHNADVIWSAVGGKPLKETILDLNFAEGDRIDLGLIDARVGIGGDDAFTFVSKFTRQAGQATITYTAGKDVSTVSFDVDGDGKPDLYLIVNGDLRGTTGNLYTGAGDTDGGWVL